jgi:hypothetical protein
MLKALKKLKVGTEKTVNYSKSQKKPFNGFCSLTNPALHVYILVKNHNGKLISTGSLIFLTG